MNTQFTRAEAYDWLFDADDRVLFDCDGGKVRVTNGGQLEHYGDDGWESYWCLEEDTYYLNNPIASKPLDLPDELRADSLRTFFDSPSGIHMMDLAEELARRILSHVEANYQRKEEL